MTRFILTKENVDSLVTGAAILGTGGGGDPYVGKLMILNELEKGRKIEIVSIDEIDENAFITPVAGMGTPVGFLKKFRAESKLYFH